MCREMGGTLAVERLGAAAGRSYERRSIQRMPSPQGSRLLKLAGRLHATLHPKTERISGGDPGKAAGAFCPMVY
jgi:hypothetical protein